MQKPEWVSRAATMDDFREIERAVAERLVEEFSAALRLFEIDAAEGIREAINLGHALTLMHKGVSKAILAWREGDQELSTSFWATEDYFSTSRAGLRFSQQVIANLQAQAGGKTIISNSLGQDEKLARWFRFLGFQEIPASGYRQFIRPPVGHSATTAS